MASFKDSTFILEKYIRRHDRAKKKLRRINPKDKLIIKKAKACNENATLPFYDNNPDVQTKTCDRETNLSVEKDEIEIKNDTYNGNLDLHLIRNDPDINAEACNENAILTFHNNNPDVQAEASDRVTDLSVEIDETEIKNDTYNGNLDLPLVANDPEIKSEACDENANLPFHVINPEIQAETCDRVTDLSVEIDKTEIKNDTYNGNLDLPLVANDPEIKSKACNENANLPFHAINPEIQAETCDRETDLSVEKDETEIKNDTCNENLDLPLVANDPEIRAEECNGDLDLPLVANDPEIRAEACNGDLDLLLVANDTDYNHSFPIAEDNITNTKSNISDSTYKPDQSEISFNNISLLSRQSDCEILNNGPPVDVREITVPPSKTSEQTTTKKYFCPFCKKLQSKFARHLEIVHKSETEVQKFLKLPKGNYERKKIIESIRKYGNYIHNTQPEFNSGILITCRRQQKKTNKIAEDYICCNHCKGFFSKRTLRLHYRSCSASYKKGVKQMMIMGRKLTGYIHPRANFTLRRKVFPILRDDQITRIIKYDELVILFGNKLCDKYTLDHQHDMIRSNLRLLGRFMTEIKKKSDSIVNLSTVFQPNFFDSTLEAIKECAGYDLEKRIFQTPSVATSLGTLLKKCLKLWMSECIKTQNDEAKKAAEDFLILFEEDIPTTINKKVLEDQMKRKREKTIVLPTKSDISCLHSFLKAKCSEAMSKLEKGFDIESFTVLSECSLVLLQTFNRRRAGEIERLLLSDYENKETIDSSTNADLYNSLSAESRSYAKKFVRITIRGKLGRTVPVLLNTFIVQCINNILTHRRNAGISSQNEYVFAVPGKAEHKKKYLRACALMRKFSDDCGAKMPSTLRGTTLRKHVATHTAMLGIEEREVSDLANFMGHHKDIHKNIYRVPIPVRDITNVSRILQDAMGNDSAEDEPSKEDEPKNIKCLHFSCDEGNHDQEIGSNKCNSDHSNVDSSHHNEPTTSKTGNMKRRRLLSSDGKLGLEIGSNDSDSDHSNVESSLHNKPTSKTGNTKRRRLLSSDDEKHGLEIGSDISDSSNIDSSHRRSNWLTVTWAQGGMQLQPDGEDDVDSVRGRCGRAGSLAATPGEKLLELLRPVGSPRRHSTAACAPAPAPAPRPTGFVYCPSDALPYCPPSRLGLAVCRPHIKIQPPIIQVPPQSQQPPPVPQRTAPVAPPPPAVPPAPPRRASPQPPRRAPPPTPPRPPATSPAATTDPNGNRRVSQPRLDCNRNPQPAPVQRRGPQKMPDTPYTPPPSQNNQTIKRSPSSGSNISVRQDSNVSSDSFSQTSSPSYTTKTMEAPLLPHQHVNKSLNAKIARGLLLKEQQEKESGNQSITKSMSTPASLQTIVRFQNGSNMSLHHRMLRDMRGAHADTSPHRFRLMQVALNAVALLAITGALFAYFRANPAVQYVSQVANRTAAAPSPAGTEPPGDRNPAPGVCLPVIVSFCHQHRISYNYTVFPNYIGHFGQRDAQQDLEIYDAVVDVRCYELTALFLCSLFVPKCGPLGHMVRPCKSLCQGEIDLEIYDAVVDVRCYELTALFLCSLFVPKCGPLGHMVRPCKSLCQETMRRCGFFLEVFGLSMPDYLQCDMFPESTDTDVCLGNKEVKEARFRASKPVCPNGFQCDVKRCIPHDWRCDGHVDCADRSDELNCRVCKRSGDVHCGNQQCISQSHICDGKVDCPWGQDERNCLRLSEENGDVGKGVLQVYQAANQSWFPGCLNALEEGMATKLCSLLGYSTLNQSTEVGAQSTGARARRPMNVHGVAQSYRAFQQRERGLLEELKQCRQDSLRVHLVCNNYECGRRRITASATKRIVGGTEAAPGDWPFLAAILGGPEEVFYCAGVLVADQWVLTASHCVGNHSDVNGWTIQLGITRRRSHAYYGQKVKVRRVVPHPLYNIGVAHDNDIALFQLAVRVHYHEHLSPVCLPPAHRALPPGTACTVIGWGKRDDKDMSEYEPAVNEVEVPVLNRELCNQWLEHRDLNVTEGMICAGYAEGGKDACQGDSGGPLLCKDPEDPSRWYVGGIVSWGIKCAHPRLPGVYAYVPKYIPWIQRQIELYNDEHAKSDADI